MQGHEIVLVDDDQWRRRGVVACLDELGGILHVLGATSPAEAPASESWTQADVVFVSADGPADAWDRFNGLDAARAVRDSNSDRLRIVLLVPHDFGQVALLRAVETGVDEVFPWDEIKTPADLELLALVPDHKRHPRALVDVRELAAQGLSPSSRPGAALAYVAEHKLGDLFDLAPQLSRRRMITLRSDLGDLLRLTPVGVSGDVLNTRTQPPWRQLLCVVNAARGCRLSFGA